MPQSVALDPAEVRPLTSREIARVLGALLGGALTANPGIAESVPAAFDHLKWIRERLGGLDEADTRRRFALLSIDEATDRAQRLMHAGLSTPGRATWFDALAATTAGFHGWCSAAAVDTAVAWVAEHWREYMPKRPREHFPD